MQAKIMKRFFNSCASRFSLYYCNAVDESILPQSLTGKVLFNPGIALYKTEKEYQRFIKGQMFPANWPVCVFFRTEEKPTIPDGLSDDACYWGDRLIEAEIVAYSKDHGETFTEVEPNQSPKP